MDNIKAFDSNHIQCEGKDAHQFGFHRFPNILDQTNQQDRNINIFPPLNANSRSRDSAVGIATGYGSEFESRQGQEFLFLHVVQTGSVAHPASCPLGKGALSSGVK
jgi:hypothetical protein